MNDDSDHNFSYWPIPFHLPSLKIRGKLRHVGYYFRSLDGGLPFVIFVVGIPIPYLLHI